MNVSQGMNEIGVILTQASVLLLAQSPPSAFCGPRMQLAEVFHARVNTGNSSSGAGTICNEATATSRL